MNFGVILPHTKLYGGVKRFLELGNALIDLHQNFTVYTPEGKAPDWFQFNGATKSFAFLKEDSIDVLFTTEAPFIDVLCSANARHKVCYHVDAAFGCSFRGGRFYCQTGAQTQVSLKDLFINVHQILCYLLVGKACDVSFTFFYHSGCRFRR